MLRAFLDSLAVLLCLPTGLALAAEPTSAPHDYESVVRGIIERRCQSCHGNDAQEAGVTFAGLEQPHVALQKRPLWKRALRRVTAGEMPPDDAEQLTADEKRQLTEWLRFALEYFDPDPRHRDPGPSVLRRLNRTEYESTLRDLFGMEFTAVRSVGLPDDAVSGGFDNQATALGLTTPLVEKYFAAADAVIAQLYGDAPEGERRGQRRGGFGGGRGGGGDAAPARRAAYDRLLFARPSENFSEREAARQILTQFTRRAFRRPVEEQDLTPLLAIFDRALAGGKSFDDSVRQTLKPVLVSPHFLFRIERDRPATEGQSGAAANANELAVRLSYFLWSTLPDEELFQAAQSGKLLEPGELERQARRMLPDPRGRALTDNFGVQWLQLARLAEARPTTEFFPAFNNQLKDAMLAETTAFFDNLRREDRSVLELLDANYTFVNSRLAEHYGIAGVSGDEPRRVELLPEHHRGGLLSMGSVLALTSHTFRTSPTQRGKYVLEVMLGSPPPPPPANAGVLKEEQGRGRRSARSFREQLAQHATQKSCAACHRQLDPLGFALDNYDAIGMWRESTPDVPLDVTGVLPDGQKLSGAGDLKRVLLERKDEFARNLVEKMLSYALGRVVDYYDEATIREVQAELAQNDYRFSKLVLGIVNSPTFQQRRPAAAGGPEEQ